MEAIEVRNMEATLASLRSEAKRVSNEIASNYLKSSELGKEVSVLQKAKEDEINVLNAMVLKQKEEEFLRQKKRDEFVKEIQDFKDSIEQAKIEKREGQKELKRINEWVLSAKKEEELFQNKLNDYENKISQRKPLIEEILKLENEIISKNKERDRVCLEYDVLVSQKIEEFDDLQRKILGANDELKSAILQVEYAKNEKQKIDNECTLKTNDLAEYAFRIKEVWNQVFPDKNMPML